MHKDPLKNRLRRLWPQIAILVVTLALCDGILSAASCTSARVRYYLTTPADRAAVPDAVLGRRMSPFYPGHDRLGFRNTTVPEHFDVLAVGDSLTYGYAAPPDGSWPSHLQQLSRRVVYNAGVGGYGPLEYAATIDEFIERQPTTVLVGLYLGNDLLNSFLTVYADRRFSEFATTDSRIQQEITAANNAVTSELSRRMRRPSRVSRAERIFAYSSLYSIGRNVYIALTGEEYRWPFPDPVNSTGQTFEAASKRPGRVAYDDPRFRTVFRDPGFLSVAVDDSDPRVREGDRITKKALLGIRDRLKHQGVRLVVVLLPFKPTVYADQFGSRARSMLPANFFELVAMEQRHAEEYRQFLSTEAIEFVDARAAMDRAFSRGEQPYPESEDDHPNTNGYRAIAQAILQVIAPAARTAR